MKALATAALATALALAPTFESTVRDAGIVGGSLLVVQRGQVVARQTAGYQDLDRKVPVSPETIFHWASITKTFTGIAIMQLRDRGLLTLDTPAVKFIPELRGVHSRFGDIEQVTIRTLMQHSAGFRASTWPWGGSEPWHPFEPASWSQVASMLPYTELLFKPGSEYRYSNPGVVFLGRIIEIVSGEDFEVYVTKNILMPLGHAPGVFRSRAMSPAGAPITQLRHLQRDPKSRRHAEAPTGGAAKPRVRRAACGGRAGGLFSHVVRLRVSLCL